MPGGNPAGRAREASLEQPARARLARDGTSPVGDEQPPPPLTGARLHPVLLGLWLGAAASATGALVAARYVEVGTLVEQSLAAALGVLLAVGLAVRAGGRALPALVLAGSVAVAAVGTGWEPLLGGAALATGVLAACLAVLGTTPAASWRRVAVEVAVAMLVATVGAVGVAGFGTTLDPERFGYTVLGLSLVAAVSLVYRLAGGAHALGRKGALLIGAALLLLVVVLAYTEALTRWGSPVLRADLEAAQVWTRDHLGAVPEPIEILLGVPALAWGVSMRVRRRQGWWMCAFGAAATATGTTALIEPGATELSTVLGAAYGVVGGLLVGLVVLQTLRLFRPRRLRRLAGPPQDRRVEPSRLRPLH